MLIKVFTDGACTSSGIHIGLGGWAFRMYDKDQRFEFEHAGGATCTTSNRMEMEAVIQSLKHIVETKHLYEYDSKVLIVSDSNLIVETLKVDGSWKKKSNFDKWDEIDNLIVLLVTLGFDIDFAKVKGHFKDEDCGQRQLSEIELEFIQMNKRVDKMATKARDMMKDAHKVIATQHAWL